MSRPRILVGDPQDLILEGLKHLFEPRYQVIAAVRDARTLLESALSCHPDLIAADLGLLETEEKHFDVLQQIRTLLPQVKVLVFAAEPAVHPHRAGISGVVPKSCSKEVIMAAVSQALKGTKSPSKTDSSNGRSTLTSRQRVILHMIADGKSGKEMAYELSISLKTVEFHRANLRRQLGVRTTAELTRYALEGIF